jgi:hypothetical protein
MLKPGPVKAAVEQFLADGGGETAGVTLIRLVGNDHYLCRRHCSHGLRRHCPDSDEHR